MSEGYSEHKLAQKLRSAFLKAAALTSVGFYLESVYDTGGYLVPLVAIGVSSVYIKSFSKLFSDTWESCETPDTSAPEIIILPDMIVFECEAFEDEEDDACCQKTVYFETGNALYEEHGKRILSELESSMAKWKKKLPKPPVYN